eukprot:gene22728-biopygen13305
MLHGHLAMLHGHLAMLHGHLAMLHGHLAMLHEKCPKVGPDRPKVGPDRPKVGPDRPKVGGGRLMWGIPELFGAERTLSAPAGGGGGSAASPECRGRGGQERQHRRRASSQQPCAADGQARRDRRTVTGGGCTPSWRWTGGRGRGYRPPRVKCFQDGKVRFGNVRYGVMAKGTVLVQRRLFLAGIGSASGHRTRAGGFGRSPCRRRQLPTGVGGGSPMVSGQVHCAGLAAAARPRHRQRFGPPDLYRGFRSLSVAGGVCSRRGWWGFSQGVTQAHGLVCPANGIPIGSASASGLPDCPYHWPKCAHLCGCALPICPYMALPGSSRA